MESSSANRLKVIALVAMATVAGACASVRTSAYYQRPNALVGEWVDLSHTSANDTSLWVLRADGYDGYAHIVIDQSETGPSSVHRTQTRYGSWYFDGSLADSAHREICFARRLGRDGGTCLPFSIDSVPNAGAARRRLVIHGYKGEHHTGDRELVERIASGSVGATSNR